MNGDKRLSAFFDSLGVEEFDELAGDVELPNGGDRDENNRGLRLNGKYKKTQEQKEEGTERIVVKSRWVAAAATLFIVLGVTAVLIIIGSKGFSTHPKSAPSSGTLSGQSTEPGSTDDSYITFDGQEHFDIIVSHVTVGRYAIRAEITLSAKDETGRKILAECVGDHSKIYAEVCAPGPKDSDTIKEQIAGGWCNVSSVSGTDAKLVYCAAAANSMEKSSGIETALNVRFRSGEKTDDLIATSRVLFSYSGTEKTYVADDGSKLLLGRGGVTFLDLGNVIDLSAVELHTKSADGDTLTKQLYAVDFGTVKMVSGTDFVLVFDKEANISNVTSVVYRNTSGVNTEYKLEK